MGAFYERYVFDSFVAFACPSFPAEFRVPVIVARSASRVVSAFTTH